MPLADIQRARELVKLQLDNLKLKEAQGELVQVSVVKSDMARLAASVKSGLMNIPDRVASQIAGMTEPHEIHTLITNEINNAIEQLGKLRE
jgi:phage terminase Nu1 subunit (DNA packaging protein)